MRYLDQFMHFEGRIGRKSYILSSIALSVVGMLVFFIALIGIGLIAPRLLSEANAPLVVDIVIFIMTLVMLYPWLAVTAKRLQDANIPGYVGAFLFGLNSLHAFTNVLGLTGDPAHKTLLDYILMAIFLIVGLAFFFELCCRRGTIGPNRFGADPLERSAPDTAPLSTTGALEIHHAPR